MQKTLTEAEVRRLLGSSAPKGKLVLAVIGGQMYRRDDDGKFHCVDDRFHRSVKELYGS